MDEVEEQAEYEDEVGDLPVEEDKMTSVSQLKPTAS